jgi:osmotically-inducible protein OsmY
LNERSCNSNGGIVVTRVFKLAAAATGAAVIALAAFLLHPRSGARRRAAAKRATVGFASLVGSAVPIRRSADTWDDTLADRVRVALSLGFGDLASGIGIRASRGVITLRGEVDELSDITRFEAAVREVGDVVDVDNLLRLRMREAQRPRVLSA